MIINNLHKTQKELAQVYIFYIGAMRIFESYTTAQPKNRKIYEVKFI